MFPCGGWRGGFEDGGGGTLTWKIKNNFDELELIDGVKFSHTVLYKQ